MTEPLDEKLYGLGLAELKTEGAAIPYDRYGPPPGPYVPPTRLQRLKTALGKLGRRLRELPERLWWASFGGDSRDDYDGGW